MKFSLAWLQQYVDLAGYNAQQIAEVLTALGFEVEGIAIAAGVKQDAVLDIAIPPNRGDCLSTVGMARELAAGLGRRSKGLNVEGRGTEQQQHDNNQQPVPIQLLAPEACPYYLGRVISGVNPCATTPDWMAHALLAADLKLISPIVDVSNYVMLELGQPLHVFDLAKITEKIVVRWATAGEKLLLLNDDDLELTTDSLVIADASQPLALAGVMGGEDSGVSTTTRNIFIECAYFEPINIRYTARRYKLNTDASYRYERQTDPQLLPVAMERITELLLTFVGGNAGAVIAQQQLQQLPQPKTINLARHSIDAVLGYLPDDKLITQYFAALECELVPTESGWEVAIPSFRHDLEIEVDLIEEIARLHGYDNLPVNIPAAGSIGDYQANHALQQEQNFKEILINRGYAEAINYSFIAPEIAELFGAKASADKYLRLQNPISAELSYMRPSLWPSLVQNVAYNQRRQQHYIKLFEVGLCFSADSAAENGMRQQKMLAGVCVGPVSLGWSEQERSMDFFDVKGDVMALLSKHRVKFVRCTDDSALHPGQAAYIMTDDQASTTVGKLGCLHPDIVKTLDLSGEQVVLFELSMAHIGTIGAASLQPISKFPAIKRDLALVVANELPVEDIFATIRSDCGSLLQDIRLFDVYTGKGVAPGTKSIAISLVLQHSARTLVEDEVNEMIEKLVANLKNKHSACLRS